ncbi:efflux RND transporter permease subunit [Parahaliea sp. F7430]|uniref:Efflux RND transporter permease subunit n=1 Tax=Sediminihaliea albiluteola TaxID=2758564 RepID=A0A7W2TTB7_9GAMM|nr:efflux RND transporter permease subunit [Sediminihaliea albiluteola]MBA6411597.1 efflux RND transporter permease subunit [Sediminihaliea albiluteola]
MERAKQSLSYVVPLTLAIIIFLLYLNFRSLAQVAMLMGALPLALAGSVWLLYLLDFNFSVAVAVGAIALAGIAVETGVIMLVYLDQSYQQLLKEVADKSISLNRASLKDAVFSGAGLRVRPVLMTAAATIVGLLPILYGEGTGSEIMSRLAAPMVGGMISSVLLTLLVLPCLYLLWRQRGIK